MLRSRPPDAGATPWSPRDAARFGAPPPSGSTPVPVPVGPLAVAGLVAAAWVGPEATRAELLTVAALLGAALAARPGQSRPTLAPGAGVAASPAAARTRLTDAELREAIDAW